MTRTTTAAPARSSLIQRMVGAARLDRRIYEEVEHDRGATGQALLVVALGAVAAGIGSADQGLDALVIGIVAALVGWAAYALVAYVVGAYIFHGPHTEATWGQLLRTLGFANAPRILLFFMLVPVLGLLIGLIVFIWMLLTTIVAIREALDFGTLRAIVTAFVSWLVLVVISGVVGVLLI